MNLLQTIYTSTDPETYVLHGCLTPGDAAVALSLSDYAIRLYDTTSSAFLGELRDHTVMITDIVSSPSHPHMLFSSQEDGGILITDLRQAKPAHFIVDACHTGITCSSISISPSGSALAVAKTSDLDVYDCRTWTPAHRVESMHWDEITRVRHIQEHILCSAGEDLMINYLNIHPSTLEDDILLEATQCGEAITKMTCIPDRGILTMVGSCENGYIFPCTEAKKEDQCNEGEGELPGWVRYARPDFFTYLVDWCIVGNELVLVSGVRTEDGEAGEVSVNLFGERPSTMHDINRTGDGRVVDTPEEGHHSALLPPPPMIREAGEEGGGGESMATNGPRWWKKSSFPLPHVHRQLTRMALGFGDTRMITGGEDGSIHFWDTAPAGVEAGGTPMGGGGEGGRERWGGGQGYHSRGGSALSSRVRGGEKSKGAVSVFAAPVASGNHPQQSRRDGRFHPPHSHSTSGGGGGGYGRGGGSAPYRRHRP